MRPKLPERQPVVPLAAVTLAVVVLILLLTNAGLGLLSGIVQLVVVAVALVLMAMIGGYLWNRGTGHTRDGVAQSRDRSDKMSPT